ncbi:MAG: PLP-dependent aminotransferase family protein [Bryobacteraceae bacterium]|nr:PLP-dependent aminotransferase family protein [Bryobacteraceae bacterium]
MLWKPQLDAGSEVALYRQLFEQIRAAIESGSLGEGDRLPPTRELAGQLGLNRTTVTAAYRLLESEGLISGQVGRGSYVAGAAAGRTALRWDRMLARAPGDAVHPPSLAASAGTISFATSRPSEELFPTREFRATIDEVVGGGAVGELLQLGSPNGYAPLRRHLLEEARQAGIARRSDDIIVTSGCQQALDLLQRVLIAPGDAVAVEDPVYPGVHHALARGGARVLGAPVGADGIDVPRLEQVVREASPKALVVTPNFQNPTGATLPLEAREAILRIAKAHGVIVVENDIYGELRYHGAALPTLKQLDETGDVVQLRSFSKIAFPGLRVGWVIAPRPLTAELAEAKQWSDLHTDHLSQAVLLRFAQSGRLAVHRQRVVKAGAERLAAALQACEKLLPDGARFTRPRGGMSLWVTLPAGLDAGEMLPRAHRENVTYLPGKYFSVNRPHSGSLRLSFAGLPPDKIRKGIAVLGGVFGEELERAREAANSEPVPAMV